MLGNSLKKRSVLVNYLLIIGQYVLHTRQDVTTVGAAGGAGLTLMKSVRNVTQGGSRAL